MRDFAMSRVRVRRPRPRSGSKKNASAAPTALPNKNDNFLPRNRPMIASLARVVLSHLPARFGGKRRGSASVVASANRSGRAQDDEQTAQRYEDEGGPPHG